MTLVIMKRHDAGRSVALAAQGVIPELDTDEITGIRTIEFDDGTKQHRPYTDASNAKLWDIGDATTTKKGLARFRHGLTIANGVVDVSIPTDNNYSDGEQLNLAAVDQFLGGNRESYNIPNATATVKGGVIVGGGLGVAGATLSVSTPTDNNLTNDRATKLDAIVHPLPAASASAVGGVKVGTNISVDSAGEISIPDGGLSEKGVVQVGAGLQMTNGLVTVAVETQNDFTNDHKTKLDGVDEGANNFTLPIATTTAADPAGGVKIGDNINVTSAGVISVPVGTSTTTLGVVRADGATITCTNGLLSAVGGGGGGVSDPTDIGDACIGTLNSAHFNNGTGGAGDAATFTHTDYGPSTSGITDQTFSGMMIRGDGNMIINTPTGKWAEFCVGGDQGGSSYGNINGRIMAVGRTNWSMKGIELKGHDDGITDDHRRLLEHDGDYMCNGYIRTGIFHSQWRNKHTGWMRGFYNPGYNNGTMKQRYFVFGSHECTKDDGSTIPGDTTYWRKSALLQTTNEDTAGDYDDYYPEGTTFLNSAPTGLIYIGCDGPKKTTHNVFVDFLHQRGTSQADVQFRTDVNVTGAFTATTVTATGSDDRLKHNESVLSNSLQVIRKLRPKKYQKTTQMKAADYRGVVDGPYRWEAGLIAQDVLQIPELTYSVLAGDYKEKDRITFTTTLDVKNSEYKGDVYEAQVKAVVTGADISCEDGLPDENARVRVIIRTDTADPVVAALRAFDATAQITVKTGADVARPYALDYNSVSMYTLSALKELDAIVQQQKREISALRALISQQ